MAGAALATAWIQLQPSFSGLQSSIKREIDGVDVSSSADSAGKKWTSRFSGALKVGLAAAATGAAAGLVAAINAASDLSEAGSAVREVFGGSAGEIEQWSKGAATALGQSQLEALNAAKTFGLYGQAAGLAGDANVTFAKDMTGLATDLASFNNSTPEEAVEAIGAALRGENEPIRKFGVLLDDATLRSKALAMGLISTTNEALTPQQKVLAAQAAIMEQTATAQGDFGRTSEGVANQQRILSAQLTDVAATAGAVVLPAVQALVSGLTAFFDFAKENEWVLPAIATAIGVLLVGAFIAWTASIWASTVALLANPITWIILAIIALIAVIVLLVMNWDAVVAWVTEIWNGFIAWIGTVTDGFVSWWNDLWAGFGDWIKSVWEGIVAFVTLLWNSFFEALKLIGTAISDWWNGLWQGIGDFISSVWNGIVEWVTNTFNRFWYGLQVIGSTISNWWNGLWQGIGDFIRSIWDGVMQKFAEVRDFIGSVIDNVSKVVKGVQKTFEDVVKGIKDAFDGIGQFIKDAFGPVADFLGGVGEAVSGFFGGMGDRARHFKGKVKEAGSSGVGGGGAALARVKATMPSGLRVTDTLSNPTRDKLLGLPRSVNSYHYDAKNPAVDIAGPTWLLHQYAAKLRAMGGWRQLLWQVPGHYDHIHVAHSGGVVDSSWYRSPGDKWDERTVRLQVGETVLPKGVSPVSLPDVASGSRRADGAAVVIQGDVYTTDIDEFFAFAEQKRRVAFALSGLEGA